MKMKGAGAKCCVRRRSGEETSGCFMVPPITTIPLQSLNRRLLLLLLRWTVSTKKRGINPRSGVSDTTSKPATAAPTVVKESPIKPVTATMVVPSPAAAAETAKRRTSCSSQAEGRLPNDDDPTTAQPITLLKQPTNTATKATVKPKETTEKPKGWRRRLHHQRGSVEESEEKNLFPPSCCSCCCCCTNDDEDHTANHHCVAVW